MVYLYVDDADALFAEWRAAGPSGQFFEPQDTEYGLREGAHVDLDGNLLWFGSSLASKSWPPLFRQPAVDSVDPKLLAPVHEHQQDQPIKK